MDGLSAAGLAELAGVTEAEVARLVELGILVARDGSGRFLENDVPKVRLAVACERAGLPMEGIVSAIQAGRLSFTFLEHTPFRRWAVRSGRTYREVSQDTGIPLETLGTVLESMGFARVGPDEPMREDELRVVPLLRHGLSSGILDPAWLARLGRAHVEGLRLITTAWGDAYQARFEGPVLASGGDQREAMERAAQLSVDFLPLGDPALLAMYHRQEELLWTEGLVERIEHELEAAGMLGRAGRVPAMVFLDLVGYTRLTEEQGDAAAAALAETLAVLVSRCAGGHGGVPVKWLGDGVMVHFREPAGAVRSALDLVDQLPAGGLPPAHAGVAAGPVVVQGGDYFGRTVNLAARIAAHAGAGQVLVSDRVTESVSLQDVTFAEAGMVRLKGITDPVRLLEARRV
ncbi:MAG TPA: adenylate/guanylate cyclase domain-containing protein [Actinomycetota bacterium]|jgi:adenylate cyclase|nr:adenylate/guanylate cyclase domain-containing protein [Actinomycetota bacterium]